MAYNYQCQRCGRPHVASWAELEVTLAADLLAGDHDPRPGAPELLRRALRSLPAGVGEVKMRTDAGYFAVDLALAAHREGVGFAIGAKRIAPVWAALAGTTESSWTEAIDMPGAQLAVTDYRPAWWPRHTRLLIRRVALAPEQISTDPRSRRRRTLHPHQRTLPLDELAAAETVYAYSFILTNLDCSTLAQAVAVEHWYRHRTEIENILCATRRPVVSPVQLGGTRREVSGSDGLPDAERLRGQEHARKAAVESRRMERCAAGPARYGESWTA